MRTRSRKHFQLHRGSRYEAQQVAQDALPLSVDLSTTAPDASAFSQTQRGNSEDIFCPRCNRVGKRQKGSPVCKDCYTALQDVAREANERDYLARYLHSRVDANGFLFDDSPLTASPSDRRTVQRLFTRAKLLGVDWTQPPMVVSDATRIRALLAPFGGEAA